MARMQLDSKYLCSVYPGKLPAVVRSHGPNQRASSGGRRTTYEFQAVDRLHKDPKKRYDVIEVNDAWESVPNRDAAVVVGGRMPFAPSLVAVEEIVRDILHEMCAPQVGIPGNIRPGIMEIANSVPTEAELAKLHAMQTSYSEYLVQEGDRLERDKQRKQITQQMRDSCKYLGVKRTWADADLLAATTACPWCSQIISVEQIVCNHCQRQVKAAPPELAALAAQAPPAPKQSATR